MQAVKKLSNNTSMRVFLQALILVTFATSSVFRCPQLAAQTDPVHINIGVVLHKRHPLPPYIQSFLNEPQQSLTDIVKNYPYHLNYGAMELLILLKALHLGGLDFKPNFERMPTQIRALQALKDGSIHVNSQALWADELIEQGHPLDLSHNIVRIGEVEKGVYTLKKNVKAMTQLSEEKLKSLKIAVVKSWALDVKTLKNAGFRNFVFVNSQRAMFELTELGRADVTFLSFSSKPQLDRMAAASNLSQIHLFPIPGVKIGIPDSRAFVLSRIAPDMDKITLALNKGLKSMLESREIEQVFIETGLYNPAVSNWKSL